MRRRVIASFSWYEAGLRGLGFWVLARRRRGGLGVGAR